MKKFATLSILLTLMVSTAANAFAASSSTQPPASSNLLDEDFEGCPSGSTPIHTVGGLNIPQTGWTTVDPFTPARAGATAAGRGWMVDDTPPPIGPDPAPAMMQTRWLAFGWYSFASNYSVAAVTPSFDLVAADPTASSFVLSFSLQNDGNSVYPYSTDSFEVWYIDNAGSGQWTQAMTRRQIPMPYGQAIATTENVLIPLTTTDLQIALVATGPSSGGIDVWMVDNLLLHAIPDAEIDVLRDGTPVNTGTTDQIVLTTPFAPQSTTGFDWEVVNQSGIATLQVSAVTTSNTQNCTAQVISSTGSVSPAGSIPVSIDITPTAFGPYSFQVEITNNDSDEGSYVFTVQGFAAMTAGTYTVGASGTYADVGEAFEALEDCGMVGPVVFEVANGSYPTNPNYLLGLDGDTLAPVAGVSASNTITVKAAAGALPKIYGFTSSSYAYMASSHPTLAIACPWVTLDGLEITGGTQVGIHVGGAVQSGLVPVVVPVNDVTIRNCRIHGISQGMGILVTDFNSSIDNLTIENCVIWDCKTCNFPSGSGIHSRGMIMLNHLGYGCRVNHNTLIQNTGVFNVPSSQSINHAVSAIGTDYTLLAEFTNNVVISTVNVGTVVGFDQWSEPLLCENNIYYSTNGLPMTPDTPGTFASWQAGGNDLNGLWADPLLVSTAGSAADAHLQAGSPARNAGATTSLTTDFEGDTRPMGGAPDIGCDEYPEPEIDVMLASTPLTSGTAIAVGNVFQSGADFVFEIANSGLQPLSVTGVTVLSATSGTTVQVTTQPASSVQPASSTTFTAHVTPGLGAFDFTLQIASNDADENPFDVVCNGTGIAPAPQIVVSENAQAIAPGAAATGGRVFGTLGVTSGATTFTTITISNTGILDLILTTPTITGVNPADFVLDVAGLSLTVTPGNATSFGVAFDPVAKGPKSASISFGHNDTYVAAPFMFEVTGAGVDPNGVVFTTTTLPSGKKGGIYTAQFSATGGTPGYSYVVIGGALPPGISLSASGVFSGAPTAEASFSFTVQVTDSLGGTEDGNFVLDVLPPPPGLEGGGGGKAGGCSTGGESTIVVLALLALFGLALRRRAREFSR